MKLQQVPSVVTTFSPVLLPAALAVSLVAGVIGATYVASVDKGFREAYGRIVDSLVTGTLGAVVGGGAVALARRSEEENKELPPVVTESNQP
jgi:predicted neutral ceramidase superfamily lipid hydrolase